MGGANIKMWTGCLGGISARHTVCTRTQYLVSEAALAALANLLCKQKQTVQTNETTNKLSV